MSGGASSGLLRVHVRVACGRIAGAAAAIVEAHRLGVPEGPHEQPWTREYLDAAAYIYSESLPPWYQSDIASLFGRCAKTMGGYSIPARLAADWVIVTDYLVAARATILDRLASSESRERPQDAALVPVTEQETPPLVIRFDALARLTTSDGAKRLEQAAVAVRHYMEAPVPDVLDEREIKLLRRLADGVAIPDIAGELGYSERSVYRALANLWKKLGVPGRKAALQKAAAVGLID